MRTSWEVISSTVHLTWPRSMGSKPFNPIEFMMRHLFPILCAFMMWTVGCADQSSVDAPAQYLLISVPTYHDSALVDIANTFETHSNGKRALRSEERRVGKV